MWSFILLWNVLVNVTFVCSRFTKYVLAQTPIGNVKKERKEKRGPLFRRRDTLRLRRLFRTRTLAERGDEEARRKRIDLWRRRTGCPWSIDLPHGTRQSIVPRDSRSLSRSCESRHSFFFYRLLCRRLSFLLFLRVPLFVSLARSESSFHRSRSQRVREGIKGAAKVKKWFRFENSLRRYFRTSPTYICMYQTTMTYKRKYM